jgi:hypothetical protein
MLIDDTQKTILARAEMLEIAQRVTQEGSKLGAVMLVTDGRSLVVTPLRLTQEEAYALLATACSALEPETLTHNSGEVH